MRINWFKDENNLVYINGETQLAQLEQTLHFPGLAEAANALRQRDLPSRAPSVPAGGCLSPIWPLVNPLKWERIFSSLWARCRSAMSSTGRMPPLCKR